MQELIQSLLQSGVEEGCFPAAAAAVGRGPVVYARAAMGRLWLPDGPPPTLDTRWDLASLTKILTATPVALLAIEQGRLTLDDTIGRFLPAPADRAGITVRQLMTHTSGIMPHVLLQEQPGCTPQTVVDTILSLPLEGEAGIPRYSCLGYIVLGRMLEALYGQPLDVLAHDMVFEPLGMHNACFNPRGGNIAATEMDPAMGKPFMGTVHDENARFMGGVSANAGLFADLDGCVHYAQMLAQSGLGLLSPAMLRKAIHNYTPGHDVHRGLGFHLGGTEGNFMGDLFPVDSFGHTGFTGTSIAADPHSGLWAVLLTNRVHPTRDNEKHLRFRRRFHNAVYAAYSQRYALAQ